MRRAVSQADVLPRRAVGSLALAGRGMLLCLVVMMGGFGCTAPRIEQPVTFPAEQYTRIYDAAISTLRDIGFQLDRQDHRYGTISTHPLGAPTLIEPWRRTNTTFDQALESTFNDQQRLVRIHLRRVGNPQPDGTEDRPNTAPNTAPPGVYQLDVHVTVQRRQLPASRLTGSTNTGRMVNHLHEVPMPLREQNVPRNYWTNLGRDEHLEARLIHQILQRANSAGPDDEKS